MKSLSCPNSVCPLSKDAGARHIVRYGFYSTNSGQRRRYRCLTRGKTFGSKRRNALPSTPTPSLNLSWWILRGFLFLDISGKLLNVSRV
jgi:hypothetical protein